MVSAKDKMLEFLKKNVGKVVDGKRLREIGGTSDWARSLRTARQEGWDLEYISKEKGYILKSLEQGPGMARDYIDAKTRVLVLKAYGYKCAYCGRNPKEDNVKLHIDHKIPVDLEGTNDFDNLQPLCLECNEGKKAFFKDEDPEMMKGILNAKSNKAKLRIFFNQHLGEEILVKRLLFIVDGREWMRALRYLREENYQITFNRKNDSYMVKKKS